MSRPKLLRIMGRASLVLATSALALGLASCGSDGKSFIQPGTPLPELKGKLAGVVWAPCPNGENSDGCGQYASRRPVETESWWARLGFIGTAYARLVHSAPTRPFVLVSLSEVQESDAADGEIEDARPVVQNSPTNAGGLYEIIDDAVDHIESCRLMVSVGNAHNGDLTRSFVYEENTDIDAASEAVVRVILNRIEKAPPVQLCDFSREGLRFITQEALKAAASATGNSVEEINDAAYRRVVCDCDVQDAIDAVTQTTPDGPRICGRQCFLSEHPGR